MPALVVEGLRDLSVAFAKADKALAKELRETEREVAKPVAQAAEMRVLTGIGRMPRSPQWAEQRIGVTRTGVYIVPKQRGVKNSRNQRDRRPKLVGPYLAEMTAALAENTGQVMAGFEDLLGVVGKVWETA